MFGNGYQNPLEETMARAGGQIYRNSNGGHTRRDILNMLRMFLQAPVLQFVRRSDTTSLKLVSDLCLEEDPSHLESALRDETVILNNLEDDGTNILHNLKILRAGIFSTIDVQRSGGTFGLAEVLELYYEIVRIWWISFMHSTS